MTQKRRLRKDHPDALILSGRARGDLLMVDHQPRGGLLLQVCVERNGREEWNFIRLRGAQVARLGAFASSPRPSTERKSRKGARK